MAVEDYRLPTGQSVFTDDRRVTGALPVAFRRSDHAHALISSISTSQAAAVPGIVAVLTARNLVGLVTSARAASLMKDYRPTELYRQPSGRSAMSGSPLPRRWLGAVT